VKPGAGARCLPPAKEKTRKEYAIYLNLVVEKFGDRYWRRISAVEARTWVGHRVAGGPADMHSLSRTVRAFYEFRLVYEDVTTTLQSTAAPWSFLSVEGLNSSRKHKVDPRVRRILFGIIWFLAFAFLGLAIPGMVIGVTAGSKIQASSFSAGASKGGAAGLKAGSDFGDKYRGIIILGALALSIVGTVGGVLPGTRRRT
jgi:hypothetical protein